MPDNSGGVGIPPTSSLPPAPNATPLPTSAPTPPVVPSAGEMGQQVASVPQASSLSAQSNQQLPTVPTQQTSTQPAFALANTVEKDLDPKEKIKVQTEDKFLWFKKWSIKAVAIGLTFQGLFGIYKSVIFILIDYPELEKQLAEHLVTQDQVNDFGIKAIMMVISTVLSMFFAMRLTVMKTKAVKVISATIGVLLFITNIMIHDYFVGLNSSQIMVDGILAMADFLKALPAKFIKINPGLKKAVEGEIEATWYK